jgi:dienelactone hydrolase
MELKIRSKKLKGKYIYADIVEHKDATTLVVFLSGFSGSKELPLFKNASDEFAKNGFSTLRINFCGDEDDKHQNADAPEILEMSFSVYITELKNVLDLVGKKYFTIVLVGHSFGAPISVMFLNKYKKYALKTTLIIWDPTLLPWKKEWMEEDYSLDSLKKLYIEKDSKNPETINETFYQEFINMKNTAKIFGALNQKTCIIGAEKGIIKNTEEYFSKLTKCARKSSKLLFIKGANHLFDGKRVQKELFEKTLGFLKG